MTVTVRMIGPLIRAAGFEERAVGLAAAATVSDLLDHVHVARTRPTIITRNGHAVTLGDGLADGDRVVISPIYSGG